MPPQRDRPKTVMPPSCLANTCEHRRAVPSGDEMVEERGVPVHEDWSMAPDDDRVRFSLSGVAPHSWKKHAWGGQDRDIQKGWIHLPWASFMDRGRAKRGKLQPDPPVPSLPQTCCHPTQCLSSSPACFGECSPPHAGQGISSWRPSAPTRCTTSHPPLRAGWRSSVRWTCPERVKQRGSPPLTTL